MKKKLKNAVWLGLPWLAVIGGFFIPNLAVAVIVWCVSVGVMAFNVKRYFDLYDEKNEKLDYEEENSVLENLILFANLYILGTVVMPFAIVYGILWGIYKGFVWIFRWFGSHKESVKRFFIPLCLNTALWGTALNYALTEQFWLKSTFFAINAVILGIAAYYGIKFVRNNQHKTAYLTTNGILLLFSISAALTALRFPELVSLDWSGMLLIIWFALTTVHMLAITLIAFSIVTVVRLIK